MKYIINWLCIGVCNIMNFWISTFKDKRKMIIYLLTSKRCNKTIFYWSLNFTPRNAIHFIVQNIKFLIILSKQIIVINGMQGIARNLLNFSVEKELF